MSCSCIERKTLHINTNNVQSQKHISIHIIYHEPVTDEVITRNVFISNYVIIIDDDNRPVLQFQTIVFFKMY